MFAICIESSHQKGMGHLYRALNFIALLQEKKEQCIVVLNSDPAAQEVLRSRGITYLTANLADEDSNWEQKLINDHAVDVWVNDRLDTGARHAANVKGQGIRLVTFDDHGVGAKLADVHVAALSFTREGSSSADRTLKGIDYLILNPEIGRYKHLRSDRKNLLVTLGGSDTYGVTIKVVRILKSAGIPADVHVGPSFRHHTELKIVAGNSYPVMGQVPSLIETFSTYDLAITGGGITPFEANASGLPCIIIANETFEIENGRFLQQLGSSIYAGYHEQLDGSAFARQLDIAAMSRIGMDRITLQGAENIYRRIMAL